MFRMEWCRVGGTCLGGNSWMVLGDGGLGR